MSDSIFEHKRRVIYAECTVGNHVYYSRYLDMLEEARGEFFRRAGCPLLDLQEKGMAFPVIEAEIAFKGPARYDDLLTFQLWLTELRGIRLSFGFRILNASGATLAEGQTRHVCVSLDEKPKRPPSDLIERLEPYLKKAEG